MSTPLAVIVGAGPGVGAATARRFASLGYSIGLVSRGSAASQLADDLEADGAQVGWAKADVTDPVALTEALSVMSQAHGRVDVLHFNPSFGREVTGRDLNALTLLEDLHLGAAALTTAVAAVLPLMLQQHTGTILATGSGAADHPIREVATLGVQKAALRSLVQTLALDLGPEGIHVATVTVRGGLGRGPGAIAPERVAETFAELAAETAGDPAAWRTVVDLTA
ncbi:SDR family NAD(P)-dependent oxidoreductase [Spongisporangium articulatum]|uniref:SDR family NAD(P)-dependent oxidoreductase n=1 Tax=Spongisporangium articulatum TaxID=3362603 RepID=A0ABW8ANK1_9ACTN